MPYIYTILAAVTAYIMWLGVYTDKLLISMTNMWVLTAVFVFCAVCAIGYGLRDWTNSIVPPAPEDIE